MKKLFYVVLCLFLAFSIINQAEAQKVKTVNGIQIVTYPKKPNPPKGVPTKLRLEEDFTIGESENPDESFSEISIFVVDDKGNIYVSDLKECNVKVFDNSGKFKQTFAKKGQGPGELNMPTGILITTDNELMVEDVMNRRLAFFTMDGQFIKNVSVADKTSLSSLIMDSQGNLLGRELILGENQLFWETKKYDKDLKPLFSIDKVKFPNPLEGKMNPFELMSYYQFGKDDNIFYGQPEKYEIKVFNPDGKHVKTIIKKYDPVKITEKDIEEALEEIPDMGFNLKDRLEFPKYFPAYQNFSFDEQGRMFVRAYEKGKGEDEYFLDIFDAEGRYIAKIPHKADPRVWKNNKLYSIEESEEGYRVIKRYSVYWDK